MNKEVDLHGGINNAAAQLTRILIVDDDRSMQQMMVNYLDGENLHAFSAFGARDAIGLLTKNEPGLVILDLRLGRDDGLDVLREIRSRSDVPVIIVTGDRCEETDRVVGLELGADDYVTKPFSLRELLARIRAVLRRRETTCIAPRRDSDLGIYTFGGWQFNRRFGRLTNSSEIAITLTKNERALLIAFVEAPQRTLSREYLIQTTRRHEDIAGRSIDVQVLRLRRKLETDPDAPRIIQTHHGFGYAFALEVKRL
ncbi:MAG: response regulator [Methylocella sp.]